VAPGKQRREPGLTVSAEEDSEVILDRDYLNFTST
jgi:hypothetical protein